MLSPSDLSVVEQIADRVARLYYTHKMPNEDRIVYSVEDLRQEFVCHVLDKIGHYDCTRPLTRWARTVIYNRARSIICDLWLEKWHKNRGVGLEVDRLFSTEWQRGELGFETPVPVFVCDATPEDVLILLDEILEHDLPADSGEIEMVDRQATQTTVEEIRDLAKSTGFELPGGEPKQDLEDLLYFALNDMDEDKFAALDKGEQARLKTLGDCYMNGDVTVVRRNGKDAAPAEAKAPAESTTKKKAKSAGKKKPATAKKPAAKKAAPKKAAKSTTKKKPKKKAAKKKAKSTAVDDSTPTGVGPKSAAKVDHGANPDGTKTRQHFDPDYLLDHPTDPKGKVHTIRVLFNRGKGITDVEGMMAALEKKRIAPSPETVRTHIRELCKFYGVERKPGKRGPKGRGVQNAIEDAYVTGHKTVAAVTRYLEKKKIEAQPSTIKGAVSLLRRADPEIQAERRAAAKSTGKKKPAAKKKAAKKKPTTKKKSTGKKKPATKKKAAKKKAPAKKKSTGKKKPTAKKRPAKSTSKNKKRPSEDAQPDEVEQTTSRRSATRRSSRRT